MNIKRLFAAVLIFACVLFVCAGVLLFAFSQMNQPVSPGGDTEKSAVVFTVERGESARQIASALRERNLVRSDLFAYFYTRLHGLSLKAGAYSLSPASSTAGIMRAIDAGDVLVFKITVPEGLTLSKTAEEFAAAGIAPEDFAAAARDPELLAEFGIPAASAEGYLFPDTYFLSYGTTAAQAVRTMLSTFFQKVSALENFPGRGARLHNRLILASIVEREYRVREEAPLIAGVFENRLRINMGLQSCATVEYILTEILGRPHPGRLTSEDIAVDSPYNTYLWAGLPPGPISSPGLTALSAAFSPAPTRYFYFRLNDPASGTHTFTVSLDDHIEAGREIYLKRAAGGS